MRLASWLDGSTAITPAMILLPYLLSLSVVLVGLLACLALVTFSSHVAHMHAARFGATDGGSGEEDGMSELLSSLPPPMALVRESSTLFRRVSTATLDKYTQRHPTPIMEGGDAANGEGEEESGRHQLLVSYDGNGRPPLSDSIALGSDGTLASDDSLAEEMMPNAAATAAAANATPAATATPAIELASSAAAAATTVDVELTEIVTHSRTEEPDEMRQLNALFGDGSLSSTRPAPVAVCESCGSSEAPSAEPSARAPASLGAEAESGGGGDEEGLDGETCWICCVGGRDAVLLECGHGGICFACAQKCARQRPPLCPMCRQRISRIVQLAGTEEVVDGEVIVSLRDE